MQLLTMTNNSGGIILRWPCIIPWYGGVNYIEVRLVYVSDVVSWLDEDAPTGFTTVVGSAIATLAQHRSAGLAPKHNQPSPLYIILIIIDC